MGILETYTGLFNATDPKSEEVNLLDIAHALSLTCRFNGQCEHFYSVAQHSLNVYHDLENLGYDYYIQLLGLLHDASEAYIGDLIHPVKEINPEFKDLENKIERTIYKKFNIPFPDEKIHAIIKKSDREVFYNEVLKLMSDFGGWLPHDREVRKINIDSDFRDMKEVEHEYMGEVKKLSKILVNSHTFDRKV